MRRKLTGKVLARFNAERDVWQEFLDGVGRSRLAEANGRRSSQSPKWFTCVHTRPTWPTYC